VLFLFFLLLISTLCNLAIAVSTIYGHTITRFKGYFGVYATLGAYYRIRLASVTETYGTLCCFRLAARWTALRLIKIAFAAEKFLLLGRGYKSASTVKTPERLFCDTHWMASSSIALVRVRAVQYFKKPERI
jgi:hypothetical protein